MDAATRKEINNLRDEILSYKKELDQHKEEIQKYKDYTSQMFDFPVMVAEIQNCMDVMMGKVKSLDLENFMKEIRIFKEKIEHL